MTPPNILLLLTDEQRFDTLGCTGCEAAVTPHLDQLRQDGVLLERHTCSSAICTPSRASLFTGNYPRKHRAWHVGYTLDSETPTLATRLSQAGYSCGFFGKSHLEPQLSERVQNLSQDDPYYGFTEHALTEDRPEGPYLKWIRREYPEWEDAVWATTHEEMRQPAIDGYGLKGFRQALTPSPLPSHLHQTPWIADQTTQFMKSHHGSPWFAACSFVDPHHPWSAPQEELDLIPADKLELPKNWERGPDGLFHNPYSRAEGMTEQDLRTMMRSYLAMVHMIDDAVGRLTAYLKETGEYDSTVILFTSDHGDYNGDRGMIRKNASLMDSLLRVPTLVKGIQSVSAGERIHTPTQHEDITPTLLELAGLPVPEQLQGTSFASLIRDSSQPPGRTHSFFEQMHTDQTGTLSIGIEDSEHWKYVRLWNGEERLVNTSSDPLEIHDKRNEHPDKLQELKLLLCDWMLETETGYPPKKYKW